MPIRSHVGPEWQHAIDEYPVGGVGCLLPASHRGQRPFRSTWPACLRLGQTHSTSASTTEGLNRGETPAILLLVNAIAWLVVTPGWL